MYLMITNRCNMRCEHCCNSCTEIGSDMTMETFRNACKIIETHEMDVSLGGGEPTLHPLFWEFFGLTLRFSNPEMPPFVATNGSMERDAMALAHLASRGVASVRLSYDQFHDRSMVSQLVLHAFNYGRRKPFEYRSSLDVHSYDYREVVAESYRTSATGRASNWGDDYCVCEDWVVTPNGDLFTCGCRVQCVGNVNQPESLEKVDFCQERTCARFGRGHEIGEDDDLPTAVEG